MSYGLLSLNVEQRNPEPTPPRSGLARGGRRPQCRCLVGNPGRGTAAAAAFWDRQDWIQKSQSRMQSCLKVTAVRAAALKTDRLRNAGETPRPVLEARGGTCSTRTLASETTREHGKPSLSVWQVVPNGAGHGACLKRSFAARSTCDLSCCDRY